jgi:hypothetical protein
MQSNLEAQVAKLWRLPPLALKARYAELFSEQPSCGNRSWLVRRLAWRLQALAEGDLSLRARQHACELANEADLRLFPPGRPQAATLGPQAVILGSRRDSRLPPAGTLLVRKYKGRNIEVMVLADSFQYAGSVYRTLSAVAEAVTGDHCNGFHFFRLPHTGERA